MTIEKLKPTYTFTEDKLNQLKDILPESFADGKINFETLKDALGEYLEEENQDNEHFGLFWVGKRQARKIASIPSKGNLVPVKGEGIDEENTKNIFIEGDNLEVLKLLQKSYANKIKMIYIDPPYNTGEDYIYEDNFVEPTKDYLKKTAQVDEQGRELTTNKKSDGRFHAKWLSMMYPRLSLARNLLKDDGVIFISIDDNEVANLKLLCNEIFGEENFIAKFIWENKKGGGNDSKYTAIEHEYIFLYSKNKESLDSLFHNYDITYLKRYKEVDDKGKFYWDTFKRKSGKQYYPIKCPDGSILEYDKDNNKISWLRSQKTFEENLKNGEVKITKIKDSWSVHFKQRLPEGKKPRTILDIFGTTSDGSDEILTLFKKNIFDNPKPSKLIKYFIEFTSNNTEEDIVLDFFAGSGTTSHSTFFLNKEDSGNRKFICVQLPQYLDETKKEQKAGHDFCKEINKPTNIAEITKERIRRVINKIKSENEGKMDFRENNQDLGFKVFKLQESNYKEWKDYEGNNTNQLEITFDDFANPLVENWKKDDLLSEIMIMEGFSLDSNIKILDEYPNNEINEVISSFCNHKLLICLDDKLNEKTIESLVLNEKDIFICLDSAIDDNYKLILSDKGLIKTI